MEKENHDEILRAIGRIEGRMEGLDTKMTEGFSRINGRLGKHDDAIAALISTEDQRKGKSEITGGVWGFITAASLIVFDHLIFRK